MPTVFDKIINNECESYKIYEDSQVCAFLDINPKTTGHFLVIPKTRSVNLKDIKANDLCYLVKTARALALHAMKRLGVEGFTLVINNGESSRQVVPYTHVHIILAPSPPQSFVNVAKLLQTSSLN